MEAQTQGSEVRRLHIVYFLSRNGGIEQPHLLRVHHHSRNGVRLRDIKRWLAELRGQDMPESFSWSYKRKYRTGYIWQDLLDDDLITPISDNEYVLKGSEISSPTINKDLSCLQKKIPMQKEPPSLEEVKGHKPSPIQIPSMDVSTKTPSEIEEESPSSGSDTSTLTVESIKLDPHPEPEPKPKPELAKDPEIVKQETMHSTHQEHQKCGSQGESANENQSNKKDEKKIKVETEKTRARTTSSEATKNNKSSSNSIFRNLMSCGNANDANESAVMAMNRKNNNKPFLNMCSSDDNNVHSAPICKRDKHGGSQTRICGTSLNQQQCNGRKSCVGEKDSRTQRTPVGAYKQIRGPNCSQCGKSFKPEKLHSHLKSCKGMKALAKGANSTFSGSIVQPTSQRTSPKQTQNKDSLSGYYITN